MKNIDCYLSNIDFSFPKKYGESGLCLLSASGIRILLEEKFLLRLKKGNPFSGKSLAIRYDLERAWYMKINKTNTPVIREGSRGRGRSGNRIGIKSTLFRLKKEKRKEKIIQYRALLISLGDKTIPLGNVISSSFILSSKSSRIMSAKGLLFTTTILAITERMKNAMKARGRLKKERTTESAKGVIQGMRMDSLFLVQNDLLKRIIMGFCCSCLYNHNSTISTPFSQTFYVFSEQGRRKTDPLKTQENSYAGL